MQKFTEPYLHYCLDNFLAPDKYKQAVALYSGLQFSEKESDLFHFFQTQELASEPELGFFKTELTDVFRKLGSIEDTFFNVFASYYFKGNYLLCHDDVVEDRQFAFSYYLEDHNSSELVLYENNAVDINKKIKVKKNRLVIFEVSNVSYHEVALSKEDSRKAITGWINLKDHGATRPTKVIPPYQPSMPEDLMRLEWPHDISKEEFFSFPGVEYEFNILESNLKGPCYERRVQSLKLAQNLVLDLKGYSLLSADYLRFELGDYLLLNDPVNKLGEDILDVFILNMAESEVEVEGDFITIVNEDGETGGSIPYATDTMFMVKRGTKNYYIDLVQHPINVAHLIYRKKNHKKQKAPQSTTAAEVKTMRTEMIKNNVKVKKARLEKKKQLFKRKLIERPSMK